MKKYEYELARRIWKFDSDACYVCKRHKLCKERWDEDEKNGIDEIIIPPQKVCCKGIYEYFIDKYGEQEVE